MAVDARLAIAEDEGVVGEHRQVFGRLRREHIGFDPEDVRRNADHGRAQVERVQRSMQPARAS